MFAGLSAFPLTPLSEEGLDEASYARLVARLADAGVDSIGALGSTGSYAYLSRAERARAAIVAVENAGSVPVIVGVGALRTRDVLANVEDTQSAGAAGVLLAPMTYQALTDDEVYGLYEHVAANLSVPLVVYDNPSTTHVHFSDELHGRIAQLSAVAAIKIPPVVTGLDAATARVDSLRSILPPNVSLGISGDGFAVNGLLAGCDSWYSAIAGVLPRECLAITAAATAGDNERARELSDQLSPIFTLFGLYGSVRVIMAVAEELHLVPAGALPRPVRGLDAQGRYALTAALDGSGLRL